MQMPAVVRFVDLTSESEAAFEPAYVEASRRVPFTHEWGAKKANDFQ